VKMACGYDGFGQHVGCSSFTDQLPTSPVIPTTAGERASQRRLEKP
jgi:hypothetical protein